MINDGNAKQLFEIEMRYWGLSNLISSNRMNNQNNYDIKSQYGGSEYNYKTEPLTKISSSKSVANLRSSDLQSTTPV